MLSREIKKDPTCAHKKAMHPTKGPRLTLDSYFENASGSDGEASTQTTSTNTSNMLTASATESWCFSMFCTLPVCVWMHQVSSKKSWPYVLYSVYGCLYVLSMQNSNSLRASALCRRGKIASSRTHPPWWARPLFKS